MTDKVEFLLPRERAFLIDTVRCAFQVQFILLQASHTEALLENDKRLRFELENSVILFPGFKEANSYWEFVTEAHPKTPLDEVRANWAKEAEDCPIWKFPHIIDFAVDALDCPDKATREVVRSRLRRCTSEK